MLRTRRDLKNGKQIVDLPPHMNKQSVITTGARILALVILITGVKFASAGIAENVHGWLWSDMPDGSDQTVTPNNLQGGRGLGWISTNNMNPDGGGGSVGYGVNLDEATGNMSGMAWSEFGGWLSFNPAGPFPAGNNTAAVAARVNPACLTNPNTTDCPVVGWARFLAGGSAQSGGWDGWVSLGGKTQDGTKIYGVNYNKATKQFSNKAWGDWVSGWISFDNARVVSVVQSDVCPDEAAYPGTLGLQTSVPAGYHLETITVYPHTGPQQPGGHPQYTIQTVCRPDVIPDVCTNVAGIQSSVPTQINGVWYVEMPPVGSNKCAPVAVAETCQDTNASNYGAPLPCSYMTPVPITDLCSNLTGMQVHLPYYQSSDGVWYSDPNHDGVCTKTNDICPVALGDQLSNTTNTWNVDGEWYGLANNVCIKDVCPDNPKYSDTQGFQAVLPTNFEVVNGLCVPKTPGTPGQGKPIDPTYKEN